MNKAVPEPVTKLIDAFSRLPGVGPKTASRLTYYLLRQPEEVTQRLADALNDLRTNTKFCSVCFNITVDDPCPICSDPKRDHHKILVVEEPLDVLAIERTGTYDGLYHVLHGAVDYVSGVTVSDLKIRELVDRVEKGEALEIIIATNPSQEGDATAMYIQRELKPRGVKITRLARGLPMGGDIEYVDTVTLSRALQGRNEL
jgi:recombination protein RecR